MFRILIFSLFIFLQAGTFDLFGQNQARTITFLDNLTAEAIPNVQVIICGKQFISDQHGRISIQELNAISCEIEIRHLAYHQIKTEIHLANKKNLIFFLDENIIILNEVTISQKTPKKKTQPKPKEIVRKAIESIERNHNPESLSLRLEENTHFLFGNEDILNRRSEGHWEINFTTWKWSLALPEVYQYDTLNLEKFKAIENFITKTDISNQKKIEYETLRSDTLNQRRCRPGNNLPCYLEYFFAIDRNLLFNPLFNYNLKTKELDHFGFMNHDFIQNHDFKLLGSMSLEGQDCYVIGILDNKKSIPISLFGNPVNLYRPFGVLFIDKSSLAFIKIEFGYKLKKDGRFRSKALSNEALSGEIYFENQIQFKKFNQHWLPYKQSIIEKDRVLKIFNSDETFHSGYVKKNLTFDYSRTVPYTK